MGESPYHTTVAMIEELLDTEGIDYDSFEHIEVRTSEEASRVRPDYSIEQGETVRGTVARGCLLF